MSINLNALKTELELDPNGLGYVVSDPFGNAAKLNAIGVETIEPEKITALSAQGAVVVSEYVALSAATQRAWTTLIAAAAPTGFPVKDPLIRAQVLAVWASGTTTRSNLGALQTRPASRAEVLFGENEAITAPQITEARSLS